MILRSWDDLPDVMRTEAVRPYYEKLKKHRTSLLLKRLFDFIVSLIMLLILWPLMLIIGLIIRFDSPGSALFLQERVTTYGKRFNGNTFRSVALTDDSPLLAA